MTFCNPVQAPTRTHWRKLSFVLGFIGLLAALVPLAPSPAQAQAQNNALFALRDTETEELLRSYELPLARAAGMDLNTVRVFIAGDLSINAFATQPQDIFIMAGMLLTVKTPNELIGVLAHETGHLSGGHLTRGTDAMAKATIPMLLSLLVGVAVMIAGGGQAGAAIIGMGQSIAQNQFNAFSRVQESSADQIAMKLLTATRQSPMGMYNTFVRFAQEEARQSYKIDPFAVSHPIGQERVAALTQMARIYRELGDSVRAKECLEAAGRPAPVGP